MTKRKLNLFEKTLLIALLGALVFLFFVEINIFNITGIPSTSNVFGDLGIGFIASATTALVFKIAEKKLG